MNLLYKFLQGLKEKLHRSPENQTDFNIKLLMN